MQNPRERIWAAFFCMWRWTECTICANYSTCLLPFAVLRLGLLLAHFYDDRYCVLDTTGVVDDHDFVLSFGWEINLKQLHEYKIHTLSD
jgi:hypothetical protein